MSLPTSRVHHWWPHVQLYKLALGSVLALVFAVASPGPSTVHATEKKSLRQSHLPNHIVVTINKSRTIHLDRPFSMVTVGSAEIADIRPFANNLIYILGKKVGTTSIAVYDQSKVPIEIVDLEVAIDTRNLQEKIRMVTGNNSIHVSSSNDSIVLTGVAADAVAADHAVAMAKSVAKTADIINAMTVAPVQQVMLKVRFLEASRTAERDLGVNWFATNAAGTRGVSTGLGAPVTIPGQPSTGGISLIQSTGTLLNTTGGQPFGVVLANLINGGTNIDVLISAMENNGLIRRLAEPNLVALSGDTARFLAGGEFPVPVAVSTTSGGVTPTIDFKKFGVSLSFVPTVLSHGLINLRIAPEVSELDFSNAVTISGTTIPALITRNAQTTIELRDGQSFAIAGLLQSDGTRLISQLPWIGNVPVLGALFRSSEYQKKETDLVIIVTPHLVKPGAPGDHLATPFDQNLPSNDVDFFVNGKTELPKRYTDYLASGGDVRGPYGYIIAADKATNRNANTDHVAK